LQQPAKGQIVVFRLVLFAVSVGAELGGAGKAFKERELLATIKTPHGSISAWA
jgi:hypothetical protein